MTTRQNIRAIFSVFKSTFTHPKPAGTPTWFDLATSDPAAARDFCTKPFGWTYQIGDPEFGFYTTAKLGEHTVAGIGQISEGSPMPSAWTSYLATDNVTADATKIKALGGQSMFDSMQVGEQGTLGMFIDPTGAVFGLWESGKPIGATLTDTPGAMAWTEVYSRNGAADVDLYTKFCGLTSTRIEGSIEYYTLQRGSAPIIGVMQLDGNWDAAIPSHW